MRILIVGAGALGGLVGASLTRSGEDVTLLEANASRARLLASAGLQIARIGQAEESVPVRVVTTLDGEAPFDLVFIAVKTYQTEDATRAALAAAGPGTLFLSMQNGIGNAEKIAALAGAERVVCGVTYHSIEHSGPGRLRYRAGIKPIQLAPFRGSVTPGIEAIGELFRRGGLDTNVVANVDHALWQKLLHNATVNPTSAITGLTCRELLGDDDLMAFMRDLAAEIIAVMRAHGVPIVDEEDPFRPIIGSLKALGKNRPSMWQDLARGTRTEVDALNGAVVDEAKRLGQAAPHNAAIVRFVHSRERQKFLRQQELLQQLGLDGGAAAGARPATLRASGHGAGTPPRVPALESSARLRELVHEYYRDVAVAAEDPDRLVAACSSLAPVEIVRALGIVPYFPENHAVLIASRGESAPALARATAEGFSPFSSAAMRLDIGSLLEGSSPLMATHGISGPPRPHVVVCSSNTGQALLRWFAFYGSHYGVPVSALHPPPALDELDRTDVNASVRQLLHLAAQLEQTTGRSLDMDRLADVVWYSAQASALWSEILDLARATPSPISFFDMLGHVAPMVLLRGTQEAVAYYLQLKAELEERVARGIAAVPEERYRFYWDGPPIWCSRGAVARLFARYRVSVVGSSFGSTFALSGLDPHDPMESLARTYMGAFPNRSEAYKAARLDGQFRRFRVDAAVFHDCRSAPEASTARYGHSPRLRRLADVPAFVIEADSHDARLFSLERLESQLGEFTDQRLPGRCA